MLQWRLYAKVPKGEVWRRGEGDDPTGRKGGGLYS